MGGTAGLTLSLGPYPDGDYQVLIADDYNFQYWASTGHLYDGFLEACSTHDQPGGAVSVYNFHVGNPPAAQPSGPVVAPAPTPTPALAPQPHAATPANVALPLGATTARRYAQGYARTKWHARKPKVIGVHRVNSSKITCRVMWHTKNGKKHSRSVVVTKTSAGVRASAA